MHRALDAPRPDPATLQALAQVRDRIPTRPLRLANRRYLLDFLLALARDRRLRPNTRLPYWAAVLRVVRAFPDLPLEQIGLEHLHQAVEGLSASRVAVVRQAWKRLRAVLEAQGLSLAPLALTQLRVPRYVPRHPVLLRPHWEQLKA